MDVCVVGAGPAGLTLARTLGSAGRRVLVLESGGFDASPDTRSLNEGEVEGEPYAGLQQTRHRQVGGTANIWNVSVERQLGAKYVPLSPRDLETWPLGWSELEPFYQEAQEICGLGPFEYGAEAWAAEGARPFDLRGTGLTSAVYQFGPADRFTRTLVEELRTMDHVQMIAGATVVGLMFDDSGGRVLGVRTVRDQDGTVLETRARQVVLATGAVENARLLLLAGLGNRGGSSWLGRGFMEHARDFSLVLVPPDREIFDRASFYDFRRAGDATWVGGRLAPTAEALEHFDLPAASMTLIPRADGGVGRPLLRRLFQSPIAAVLGHPHRNRYGWSDALAPSRRFDVFGSVLNLEQRPDPRNRIELGRRRDRFGNPLPRLVLAWTDEEQARLERLRTLMTRWLRAAGLGHLHYKPGTRPDLSAHHHAGTTRMALDPEDGVVDPWGQVFGVANLYVAGASLFPAAGFANPALTIVALALRLARHLEART